MRKIDRRGKSGLGFEAFRFPPFLLSIAAHNLVRRGRRRALLKKGTSVGVVGGRSNKERRLFRFNHESDGRPNFPGDTRTMEVPYRVNDQLFEKHGQILDQSGKATSYIHDDLGDSIERPARDLQHF